MKKSTKNIKVFLLNRYFYIKLSFFSCLFIQFKKLIWIFYGVEAKWWQIEFMCEFDYFIQIFGFKNNQDENNIFLDYEVQIYTQN